MLAKIDACTEDSVGDPEDRECLTSTFSVEGTVYRQ